MITSLNIANAALVKIGEQAISAMDENQDRAFAVRECWEISLSAFLSEFDWSFATRVDHLVRLPEGDHDPAPYRHAYALPNGCVKLITVFGFRPGGRGMFSALEKPDYEKRISGSELQAIQIICSNWGDPMLKYVSLDATLDMYTPAAREALVYRLAIALDEHLAASAHIGNLTELYARAKENAIYAEARTTDIKKLVGTYTAARTGAAPEQRQ